MSSLTRLATMAAVSSLLVLVVVIGALIYVWQDMDSFYENKLNELEQFKIFSNDAWDAIVYRTASVGTASKAGRSFFPHRKRRQADDSCACVESAQVCPRGPPGPPGRRGSKGIPGEKGIPGPHGPHFESASSGATGAKKPCVRCPIGHPGEPGPNGKKGIPGRPGEQGKRGLPGRHGMKGVPGPAGDPGLVGPQGELGREGPPGQNGIRGRGKRGRKGPKGLSGARGKAGKPGKNGEGGLPGVLGSMGPPGKNGIPGEHGSEGPEGYPGLPGKDFGYCLCPASKNAESSSMQPYLLGPPPGFNSESFKYENLLESFPAFRSDPGTSYYVPSAEPNRRSAGRSNSPPEHRGGHKKKFRNPHSKMRALKPIIL